MSNPNHHASAVLVEELHDGPYEWPQLHSDGRPDTVGDLLPLARRLRRAGARVRVEVRR